MASLMHLVTGRKRECTVWQHFEYLEGKKKSKCLVVDESGKMCGFEVAGKNPTNLKGHLNTRHKDVYAEVCGKEQDRKHSLKRKRDDDEADDRKSDSVPKAGSSQTLSECMNRRIATWSKDSIEYKYRLDGVLQMLISSCRPVTMVDAAGYRESMRRCDPKFIIPGMDSLV